jgi:transcriptional regulator with XRE-family HTH domain
MWQSSVTNCGVSPLWTSDVHTLWTKSFLFIWIQRTQNAMSVAIEPKIKKPGFALLLKKEFARRCKSNPRYSLRAFASQIGVDPSLLSKVVRGERNPSVELIKKVGPAIGLKPRELFKVLHGKSDFIYNRFEEDTFALISDWFHFAILELMKTKNFSSDPGWISQRLSIHKAEAVSAIERLCRLKIIEFKNEQLVFLSSSNTWANNEMTTVARQNLQKQLALKAAVAIESIPFESRESGSLTIACSKKMLPEIKKKIQVFRREIDEFLETAESPDEVYQLLISFYPITKIN